MNNLASQSSLGVGASFKDPRLSLTAAGEFLVRFVSYVSYILLSVSTAVLFSSDSGRVRNLSFFLILFLVDRVMHIGQAEKSLSELNEKSPDLAQALTPSAYRVLGYSFRKSYMVGQNFHLLLLRELIEKKDVIEILKRLDVKINEFSLKTNEFLKQEKGSSAPDRASTLVLVSKLVQTAYESALLGKERFIESRSLFAALSLADNPAIRMLFDTFNLNAKDIQAAAVSGRFRRIFGRLRFLPAVLGGFAGESRMMRHRFMNRSWTARPTPTLDQFSTDLTDLARMEKIGFLVGHEKEYDELIQVVSRPGKPNAILVGDPGIGKSSIIAHLAYKMIKDDVPPVLFDKRLVSLQISRLVADATGDVLSGRLQKVTEEIIRAGNIVLFIPNIHDLFRTAEVRALNAIDVIFPVIKANAIPVIGESYPREFKQFVEPRSDFMEQFEVVRINELSEDDAVRYLTYEALILEKQYRVFITYRAVREAVLLGHRYLHNKPLPGSATDLLKMALTEVRESKNKSLDADMVAAVAEKITQVPIQKAGKTEVSKLLNLEEFIHEKFVDQDAAVRSVSRALREYRSGLTRRGGPIASFLFVGPTGVGKTELAKILAQIQFGSKEAMRRFDMSEYQDKTSSFRLIGNPDGSKTGALTDAILEKPYSLILLDEFEKAHPDILNLFLQVLDDGRLTDSLSRTVSFENTIIIATSNAHSEFIKSETEKGRLAEDIADEIKKKLTDYFKPELLNRFSDIMVFRNLNKNEISSVAGLLVQDLSNLVFETNGITLLWDASAIVKLADLGFSPVFGARPLRQTIADNIRSVLAEKILKEEIRQGDKVSISFGSGAFKFETNQNK
jgi:ATP-dependent Clp protease ATP-binding subunit ClpC